MDGSATASGSGIVAYKDAPKFTSSSGLETRTETKDGETEYFVKGYISTHDKDLVNDIVTEHGMAHMKQQIEDRNVKIDLEHEAFRGDTDLERKLNKTKNPIGRIVDVTRDDTGLMAEVKLNKAHRRFDEVWGSIKDDMLDGFSIAFLPEETDVTTTPEGEDVRLLDRVRLLNVALTGNPVNPEATMQKVMTKALESFNNEDIKGGDPHGMNMQELEARLKAIEDELDIDPDRKGGFQDDEFESRLREFVADAMDEEIDDVGFVDVDDDRAEALFWEFVADMTDYSVPEVQNAVEGIDGSDMKAAIQTIRKTMADVDDDDMKTSASQSDGDSTMGEEDDLEVKDVDGLEDRLKAFDDEQQELKDRLDQLVDVIDEKAGELGGQSDGDEEDDDGQEDKSSDGDGEEVDVADLKDRIDELEGKLDEPQRKGRQTDSSNTQTTADAADNADDKSILDMVG